MNRYLRTRIRTTAWESKTIRRSTQRQSYTQGSFSMTAGKGTDLKEKRLFRPRWITLESLVNVKGMDVISHGLRPVPINRWTVLLYCSRWLGICFCATLIPLLFVKPKVSNVIRYRFYIDLRLYAEKYVCMIMLLSTLFLMLYMLHSLLIIIHTCMSRWWRYVLHDLRLKIIIPLGK
jgi:hypothetical protein